MVTRAGSFEKREIQPVPIGDRSTPPRVCAVPDDLERFTEDVRRYIAAGERLVAGVTEFNAMNRAALEDLADGMSVTESFRVRDSAGWSRRVSSLLDDFEACRRATRTSAAAVLQDEGRTITEVGRAFGVSHQLASRFANAGAPVGGDATGPVNPTSVTGTGDDPDSGSSSDGRVTTDGSGRRGRGADVAVERRTVQPSAPLTSHFPTTRERNSG